MSIELRKYDLKDEDVETNILDQEQKRFMLSTSGLLKRKELLKNARNQLRSSSVNTHRKMKSDLGTVFSYTLNSARVNTQVSDRFPKESPIRKLKSREFVNHRRERSRALLERDFINLEKMSCSEIESKASYQARRIYIEAGKNLKNKLIAPFIITTSSPNIPYHISKAPVSQENKFLRGYGEFRDEYPNIFPVDSDYASRVRTLLNDDNLRQRKTESFQNIQCQIQQEYDSFEEVKQKEEFANLAFLAMIQRLFQRDKGFASTLFLTYILAAEAREKLTEEFRKKIVEAEELSLQTKNIIDVERKSMEKELSTKFAGLVCQIKSLSSKIEELQSENITLTQHSKRESKTSEYFELKAKQQGVTIMQQEACINQAMELLREERMKRKWDIFQLKDMTKINPNPLVDDFQAFQNLWKKEDELFDDELRELENYQNIKVQARERVKDKFGYDVDSLDQIDGEKCVPSHENKIEHKGMQTLVLTLDSKVQTEISMVDKLFDNCFGDQESLNTFILEIEQKNMIKSLVKRSPPQIYRPRLPSQNISPTGSRKSTSSRGSMMKKSLTPSKSIFQNQLGPSVATKIESNLKQIARLNQSDALIIHARYLESKIEELKELVRKKVEEKKEALDIIEEENSAKEVEILALQEKLVRIGQENIKLKELFGGLNLFDHFKKIVKQKEDAHHLDTEISVANKNYQFPPPNVENDEDESNNCQEMQSPSSLSIPSPNQEETAPSARMRRGTLIRNLKNSQFSDIKSKMNIRSILKTISLVYSEILGTMKNNRELSLFYDISFSEYVYDHFITQFGFKKIGEKKYSYFIMSAKSQSSSFRVNTFLRLMGFIPDADFNLEQAKMFFRCLHILESSNKGAEVIADITSSTKMFPFLRAEQLVKDMLSDKVTYDKFLSYRKRIASMKEQDKKFGNINGIIDADKLICFVVSEIDLVIQSHSELINSLCQVANLGGSLSTNQDVPVFWIKWLLQTIDVSWNDSFIKEFRKCDAEIMGKQLSFTEFGYFLWINGFLQNNEFRTLENLFQVQENHSKRDLIVTGLELIDDTKKLTINELISRYIFAVKEHFEELEPKILSCMNFLLKQLIKSTNID